MNYLDAILCVLLVWGAWRGFRKGLIIAVASLIALGLGIYGGILFSEMTANWLSHFIDASGQMLHILAFVVTFIAIVIGVHFIARMLEKVIRLVALRLVNKLAGALFGAAKMALILSVLLLLADSIDRELRIFPQNFREESLLYKPVSAIVPAVIPVWKDSRIMQYLKGDA